jgi:hypothetical protein
MLDSVWFMNLHPRTATEPPPTFPFLESQCQRAALRHELLLCQRSSAARKIVSPAGGADRVYRGVPLACQTVNVRLWQIFFSPGKHWKSGPSDHNQAVILWVRPLPVDAGQENPKSRPGARFWVTRMPAASRESSAPAPAGEPGAARRQ